MGLVVGVVVRVGLGVEKEQVLKQKQKQQRLHAWTCRTFRVKGLGFGV